MNGERGRFTSWLVKMLTTAGIAWRAASRNDVTGRPGVSVRGSVTVTTAPRLFQERRSGRSVETTNRAARQTVAVCANMSQNFRIGRGRRGVADEARYLLALNHSKTRLRARDGSA